jgi:hypothetical protein
LSALASRTTSVVRPADSKRTVEESAALHVPAGLDAETMIAELPL